MTPDILVPPLSSDRLAIVLDYSVLDHLQRIQAGTYAGSRAIALQHLRTSAESQRIDIWIAEITPVEMLHGIEKVTDDEARRLRAVSKDAEKRAIAKGIFARTLGYPCSKIGDTYSRIGMSFRIAGPDGERANALEERLLTVFGISAGDARQLVCCAFPFDGEDVAIHPKLDWFIAEDQGLIDAVNGQVKAGALPELAHLRFGSSDAVVAAHPTLF